MLFPLPEVDPINRILVGTEPWISRILALLIN